MGGETEGGGESGCPFLKYAWHRTAGGVIENSNSPKASYQYESIFTPVRRLRILSHLKYCTYQGTRRLHPLGTGRSTVIIA